MRDADIQVSHDDPINDQGQYDPPETHQPAAHTMRQSPLLLPALATSVAQEITRTPQGMITSFKKTHARAIHNISPPLEQHKRSPASELKSLDRQ